MNKTIKFTSRKATKLEYIALNLYSLFTNTRITLAWLLYILGINVLMIGLNFSLINQLLTTVVIVAVLMLLILIKIVYFSFGPRVKNSQAEITISPDGLEIEGYYGKSSIKYIALANVKAFQNFLIVRMATTNNIAFFITSDAVQAADAKNLITEYSKEDLNNQWVNILMICFNIFIIVCITFAILISAARDSRSAQSDTIIEVADSTYPTAMPNVLTIDEIEYTKWRGKDIEMFLPSKIASTQTYYQIAGDMYPYIGNDGIIDNFPTQYQTSFSLEYGEMDVALLRVFVEDTASLNVDSVGRVNMTDTMLGLTLPQATCRTGDLELLTSGFSKREVGFCELPQGTEVIGTATQYIKKISDTKYVVVFYFPNDYFDREMFEEFVLINIKPAL